MTSNQLPPSIIPLNPILLPAYRASINASYHSDRSKQTLRGFNALNSSPFALSQITRSRMLGSSRLVNIDDIETTKKQHPNLDSFCVEPGLALLSNHDSYAPLDMMARVLANDLKRHGVFTSGGVIIPYSELVPHENDNSFCGLTLRLKPKASLDLIRPISNYPIQGMTKKDGVARVFFNQDRYFVGKPNSFSHLTSKYLPFVINNS